ncbi:MAG: LuxR C-terminal-related transcriptional regulator [Pseudomonadales bacterium]
MLEHSGQPAKQVLIVEDHGDASIVLEKVARQAFDEPTVVVAGTIKGGKEQLASHTFDIALLDIGLPDGNGIELVQLIADKHPQTLTIVTTIFDDDAHLFQALKAGADGYLIKGHTVEELTTFFVNAISGRPALSPGIALSMLGYFRSEEQKSASQPVSTLTERETEILQFIAKGSRVKEVSRLLDISENTVSHHVKNIYAKLNVHNRAEATAAAVQLRLYNPE